MTPPGCLWALPPFIVGVLIAWLAPVWATGGLLMHANAIMRLVATICFVLAIFGVAPGGLAMVPLGLALWCGSTLVP